MSHFRALAFSSRSYSAKSLEQTKTRCRPHMYRPFSSLSLPSVPTTLNEPMLPYSPSSPEFRSLSLALSRLESKLSSSPLDIPAVVNGKEIRSDGEAIGSSASSSSSKLLTVRNPSNHSQVLATFRETDRRTGQLAIDHALSSASAAEWRSMTLESRSAVFLKAADLLAHKYRADMCAAIILGQGKNIWQAEIDGAAEQADFWRFNAEFAQQIYATQPTKHAQTTWNRHEYRPLEGFVFAISPFNFAAIGSNLSCAPAQMGNVVLWKPSNSSLLANYLTYQILLEAGLPPGVISFLPGSGHSVGSLVFSHSDFAGLHFTGSTATFRTLWKTIASNLEIYKSYPRIVGETGGKNFHFVHASADVDNVVRQTIRGAFEYSGQKCSATSRAYFPSSLWSALSSGLISITSEIISSHFCASSSPSCFVGPVIDSASFQRLSSVLSRVRSEIDAGSKDVELLVGGRCDDSVGYFVEPTIFRVHNPMHWLMKDEFFGPILAIYVYDDSTASSLSSALDLCDSTSPYALTGSIFARDRLVLDSLSARLLNSCGNLYLNDKSTGAVVGQQAFGGARASGTNDKAGSAANLMRWVNQRTIKESFTPITDWKYPSLIKK